MFLIEAPSFFCFAVPMMPLTGKERRKYLAALKEKNVVRDHIASDPAGLLLQRGKRDPSVVFEISEGDIDRAACSSGKGVVAELEPLMRLALFRRSIYLTTPCSLTV